MDIGPIDVGLSKDVEVIPHVFIYNMIVYIYIHTNFHGEHINYYILGFALVFSSLTRKIHP